MRLAPFPSLEPGAWSLLVTVLLECLKKKNHSLLYLLPLARLIQRPQMCFRYKRLSLF